MKRFSTVAMSILFVSILVSPAQGNQSSQGKEDSEAKRVANYWTDARVSSATPRDFLVDTAGNTFMGDKNGKISNYGDGTKFKSNSIENINLDAVSTQVQIPQAGPVKLADTLGPVITGMTPVNGATSSSTTNTFVGIVTDVSGIRSVSINLRSPTGVTTSYSANRQSRTSNNWSSTIRNLTSGTWSWTITAIDSSTTSNQTVSPTFTLAISTPTTNSSWKTASPVLSASGRLLFEMPTNTSLTTWAAYVCSASVVNDGSTTDGQSLLLTAAHCVYDDTNKSFARNVIFIPNQQASGTRTDSNCANDIYGCWVMNFGIVDTDWTTRVFPNNIPWDYGYYVVSNTGKHRMGTTPNVSDSLETAVSPMSVNFTSPLSSNTSAFGYSYSSDPNLMYCAQSRGVANGTTAASSDNWWLNVCGLSGGASGGPWVDENSVAGSGQIFSVNSWGYTNSPGMAGPKLNGSSKTVRSKLPICIYNSAKLPMTANKVVTVCP